MTSIGGPVTGTDLADPESSRSPEQA